MNDPIFSELDALEGGGLDGATLSAKVVLVVNVASRCGLTPQYEELERLQQRFGGDDFTVVGVPCNQFAGQEPGSAEEIREFCSTNHATTFPLTEKVAVNGARRHPLFELLTAAADSDGRAGEVEWNFEKFLVAPSGVVLARFRPPVLPESDVVVNAIEEALRTPEPTSTVATEDVQVGDRIATPSGTSLHVTRIDTELMGRSEYLVFVEDSPVRWLKVPMRRGTEVTILKSP